MSMPRPPQKTKNWGPSLTKQEPAKDADINTMVSRFFKTGYMPQSNKQPRFGDFTGPGFQEMNNSILAAQAQFMGLPPKLRKRFQNDPGVLINWLDDPENHPEAIELGLLPEPPPTPPEPAKKADPEAQPSFQKPKTPPEGD